MKERGGEMEERGRIEIERSEEGLEVGSSYFPRSLCFM
jgi:hypothetical protein